MLVLDLSDRRSSLPTTDERETNRLEPIAAAAGEARLPRPFAREQDQGAQLPPTCVLRARQATRLDEAGLGRGSAGGTVARHKKLAVSLAHRRLEEALASDGEKETVTVTPPESHLQSMSNDMHRVSALAGLGIAGLPSFSIDDALRDGRLEQVLPDWHVAELSIWACMPS